MGVAAKWIYRRKALTSRYIDGEVLFFKSTNVSRILPWCVLLSFFDIIAIFLFCFWHTFLLIFGITWRTQNMAINITYLKDRCNKNVFVYLGNKSSQKVLNQFSFIFRNKIFWTISFYRHCLLLPVVWKEFYQSNFTFEFFKYYNNSHIL